MTTIPNSIPFEIPPEIEAEMTPAVKAFVLMLMSRIEQLEAQVLALSVHVQTRFNAATKAVVSALAKFQRKSDSMGAVSNGSGPDTRGI